MTILAANSPEWASMAALTVPNKRQYAEKWDYQFKHVEMPHKNGFCRAKLWRRELEQLPRGDWMWFLGCDTVITNHNKSAWIQGGLSGADCEMVIGLDALGINCDSFFITKNCRTLAYLDYVISMEGELPNEQEALWQGIGELRIDCVIKPQRLFNSYLTHLYPGQPERGGAYKKGDFVLHLPALPYDQRMSLIKHYLTEVIL